MVVVWDVILLLFYEYVSQYSDLAEAERSLILDTFRHATMKWNQNASAENEEQKSHMIVATDACLPLLASGESPITSSVLINYQMPTKKVLLPVHHIFTNNC